MPKEQKSRSKESQNQQKLLELGLKKYGKDVPDRWDKIADDVTGSMI